MAGSASFGGVVDFRHAGIQRIVKKWIEMGGSVLPRQVTAGVFYAMEITPHMIYHFLHNVENSLTYIIIGNIMLPINEM